MHVNIQVNTKTTEHREVSHAIPSMADLPALIANVKAQHKDVTSITVIVLFNDRG